MINRRQVTRPWGKVMAKPPSIASMSSAGESQRIAQPARRRRPSKALRTSNALSDAGKTLPFPSILVATPSPSKNSIVLSTVNAFKAGPRNFPPASNACWMLRAPSASRGSYAGSIGPEMPRSVLKPRALVRLQRVPPDMRILTPARRFFSRIKAFAPSSAARIPANNPAAPPPKTTTSWSNSIDISDTKPPPIDRAIFVDTPHPSESRAPLTRAFRPNHMTVK